MFSLSQTPHHQSRVTLSFKSISHISPQRYNNTRNNNNNNYYYHYYNCYYYGRENEQMMKGKQYIRMLLKLYFIKISFKKKLIFL